MNFGKLKKQWIAVCKLNDLRNKPLAATLFDLPVVLYKANEKVIAMLDKCPHRGVPLSRGKIDGDNIVCAYHGWRFNSEGNCTAIPGLKSHKKGNKCVERFAVKVYQELVFVCIHPSEETKEIPYSQTRQLNDCQSFLLSFDMAGDLINVIENFLDGTHTHFVHSGIIRRGGHRSEVNVQLEVDEFKAQATYFDGKKQSGIISQLFERDRSHSIGRFQYPLTAEIEYYSNQGLTFKISAFICPQSSIQHKIHARISYKKTWMPGFIKKLFFMPLFNLALRQDKQILRLQQENLARFSDGAFVSSELDLLREPIKRVLEGKSHCYKKDLTMLI